MLFFYLFIFSDNSCQGSIVVFCVKQESKSAHSQPQRGNTFLLFICFYLFIYSHTKGNNDNIASAISATTEIVRSKGVAA